MYVIWYKVDGLDAEEEAADIAHDERRWKLADTNADTKLDKAEFASFIHPEEALHMKESIIQVHSRLTHISIFISRSFVVLDWVCGLVEL